MSFLSALSNPVGMTNVTQRILSQSNNISYGTRGVYRVKTVDDKRKADYLFRDFYMTFVTAYATELAFRMTDRLYTDPQITELLRLNKLAYKHMPDVMRSRFFGSLVRESTNSMVPEMLKKLDAHGKLPPAKKEQVLALAEHLQRQFHFKQYVHDTWVKQGQQLSTQEASTVFGNLDQVADSLKKAGKDLTYEGLEKAKLTLDEVTQAANGVLGGKTTLSQKAREVLKEALENKAVLNELKRVQKNAIWPKMLMTMFLNFVTYGVAANYVDVHVIQPWQEKVVKERGHTRDVVKPSYWALIPGMTALVGTSALLKRLPNKKLSGYVTGFAISGLAGLATYTAAALLLIKHQLAKPFTPKPNQSASPVPSINPLAHPPAFQVFERPQAAR